MADELSALNRLLDDVLPFAKEMLERAGDFYAFAAAVRRDGRIENFGAMLGDDEHPDRREVYKFLESRMRKRAECGEFIAIALAGNADIPPEVGAPYRDGVRVLLEAATGDAFVTYLPYDLRRKSIFPWKRRRSVSYAELRTVRVKPRLFPPASAS